MATRRYINQGIALVFTVLLRSASGTSCGTTTAKLQGILDATAAAGGGWAQFPCGFHTTEALTLPSGVKLGSWHCATKALTLGACEPGSKQQHIISVGNGTGHMISGIRFDHTNLTDPSTRTSCAVAGGSGATNFVLESSHFLNINTTSHGFSAIQMAGCEGCVVRGNVVPKSGGDALNFNSGTYIITDNLVENVGDGCIAMNNNAFGLISNNVLRSCNLGVGAGPSGSSASAASSTPFVISGNQIEDCDYGILLGWFGYAGRVGPIGSVVSNNVILRPRSCGIQYNGGPGAHDGSWIVQGNQIMHSGFPATPPPHTDPSEVGPGRGIYAASLSNVHIIGNAVTNGRGDAITAMGLHFIISGNILQGPPPSGNTTTTAACGITVPDSVDVTIVDNNCRGFGTAIAVADKDRLVVRGNSIDVSHSSAALGVVVEATAARVVVSDNTVSGSVMDAITQKEQQCFTMAGAASSTRVSRNNLCW